MPIDRSQAQVIAAEIIEAMAIRTNVSSQEIREQIEQGNPALVSYFSKQLEARLFRIAAADPENALKPQSGSFPKSLNGRTSSYHPSATQLGRVRPAKAFF